MKITFIRPSIHGIRSHDAMEPLVFAILKGLTPPEVEVQLFDERLEEVPPAISHETDLVALTVETYTARRAYQIASDFRRHGIPVVMGGYHPTFLPDEALQYADSVVLGDAEKLWGQVVQDVQAGKLQSHYQGAGFPSMVGLNYDRTIFAGKRYKPILPVQYGRGCKFACDFCSIHAFYGKNLRQRPVEEVIEEIRASGRQFILIVDDNIFVDIPKAKELFEALIPLKIKWGCQVSIDVAKDDELLDLMARSGCIAALIGFESLNEENLRQMKKRWNLKHSNYQSAIEKFQEHGIMIYGSFIFGYDHDTADSFERTVQFALESKLFLVNFSALTPTPGARLYDRLNAEGRLLYDKWWLDPTYRYGMATYRPAQMTTEELTQGCIDARKAFYSLSSITKRLFERRTNLRSLSHAAIYLGANLISRRELKMKLGRRLGREDGLGM